MKITKLTATAALLSATLPAFASEWVDFSNVMSTRSRAEVIAELRMAQADGSYAASQSEFVTMPPQASAATRTREDVRAEAIDAARNHTSDLLGVYFGG